MNISSLMRPVAIAVLGVAACTATACDSPTQSTAADLSASVAVSRAQFRSGDSTTFTTTIVNNGETRVLLAEPGCVAYFEVVSGTNVVAPGQFICALIAYGPIELAPGQTKQFTEVWHGENRTLQVMLGAGAYSVRAKVMTTVGAVVSAPVPIEILP